MTKNKLLVALGILIIGVAITFNGYFVGNALKSLDISEPNTAIVDNEVLNLPEVSKYLNMSEEDVKGIIYLEKSTLEKTGSFDGEMFPYFIVNGKQYFYKDQIDEWLKEVSSHHREYNLKEGWVL